eukprot:1158212-Pelagomonas_calceolata.AAC.5
MKWKAHLTALYLARKGSSYSLLQCCRPHTLSAWTPFLAPRALLDYFKGESKFIVLTCLHTDDNLQPSDPLSSGATALFIAARCNHIESGDLRVEKGSLSLPAQMRRMVPRAMQSLMIVCANPECCAWCMNRQAGMDMGATPFWIAKSSGFCACAQLLESSKNARPVAQVITDRGHQTQGVVSP